MIIPATLCYIIKNNKVLMLHRVKKKNDIHKDKWNGLGGKMEKGESPTECVIREVYEESGLKITNPTLKGVITFPEFDGKNDWLVFVYIANNFTGDLIQSSEGVLEWIKKSELLSLPLWDGDKIFIPWLFEKNYFTAKFTYKNKKLINWTVEKYSV